MNRRRRKVVRAATSLPVEWGLTPRYEYHGKITSLSPNGCLLQTESIQPLYGKTIHLRIPLPEGDWCEVRGRALYYLRDTGFGVEFSDLTQEDSATLRRLMRHHGERPPDPDAE
ncbi:MAG: PilZ domain-containing protein [Acidobacteriota bacterium]|nr:PilZ domain-containing protein [Acidobacteriota bacterium]